MHEPLKMTWRNETLTTDEKKACPSSSGSPNSKHPNNSFSSCCYSVFATFSVFIKQVIYIHSQTQQCIFCPIGYKFRPLRPSSGQYCTKILKSLFSRPSVTAETVTAFSSCLGSGSSPLSRALRFRNSTASSSLSARWQEFSNSQTSSASYLRILRAWLNTVGRGANDLK